MNVVGLEVGDERGGFGRTRGGLGAGQRGNDVGATFEAGSLEVEYEAGVWERLPHLIELWYSHTHFTFRKSLMGSESIGRV